MDSRALASIPAASMRALLSIPLNGFDLSADDAVEFIFNLSIPLNGFLYMLVPRYGHDYIYLSIPLNGFPARWEWPRAGWGGRLSIPLNGFSDIALVWLADDGVVLSIPLNGFILLITTLSLSLKPFSFNSIEWILGRSQPRGAPGGLPSFNSIEWIPHA